MKCPVCWRDVPINPIGNFPKHRTKKKDDYSFCPMSGQPVPIDVVAGEAEDLD